MQKASRWAFEGRNSGIGNSGLESASGPVSTNWCLRSNCASSQPGASLDRAKQRRPCAQCSQNVFGTPGIWRPVQRRDFLQLPHTFEPVAALPLSLRNSRERPVQITRAATHRADKPRDLVENPGD